MSIHRTSSRKFLIVSATVIWSSLIAMFPSAALAQPGAAAEQTAAGLFRQAYEASRNVATVDDCTKVIELCDAGTKLQSAPDVLAYGKQLGAWAHNKRGELRVAADPPDEEQALKDFEAAVRLDNTKAKYLHNRGVSYGGAGELEKARQDFDAVLELDRNFAKAWFNRAEILVQLGDYAAAMRDYSQVLSRDPGDSAAYNARGFAYYKQRNYLSALNDYGRAISQDRENHEAYTNRGDAYADLGRFADARRDYERALQIDPESPRAHLSIAWLQATCSAAAYRNPEAALEAARKAIELGGETARSLDILAAALARAEKYPDAVETQKKAIQAAKSGKAPEKEMAALEARLKRYESNKPYVDVPPGQPQPE